MEAPPRKVYRSRALIHYREFAGDWGHTTCGRTSGYRRTGAEVPWQRNTVKLVHVTCAECLVMVVQRCKKQLHATKPPRDVVRQAHTRVVLSKLRELVSA
jgi:hypothetical protein